MRRGNTGWKDGCYSVPAGGPRRGRDPRRRGSRVSCVRRPACSRAGGAQPRAPPALPQGDGGGEWLGAFVAAGSGRHAGHSGTAQARRARLVRHRRAARRHDPGTPARVSCSPERESRTPPLDGMRAPRPSPEGERVEDALLHADMDRRPCSATLVRGAANGPRPCVVGTALRASRARLSLLGRLGDAVRVVGRRSSGRSACGRTPIRQAGVRADAASAGGRPAPPQGVSPAVRSGTPALTRR